MPIAPSLIGGSLPGWTFLQSTLSRQQETFNSSPDIERNVEALRTKLADPFTLDTLMGDRQLLGAVLQSFGLEDEINKGAFLRKIIEDGPEDPNGFARRLNSPEFLALSETFQADSDGLIRLSGTQLETLERNYLRNAFEVSVGEQEPDLRLALNFEDVIQDLAAASPTDRSFWFRVIGNTPVFEVFRSAFILPDGFQNLDVDKQADLLQSRAEQRLGDDPRAKLASGEAVETTIRQFLLQRQLENGPDPFSSATAALTLLNAGSSFGTQSLTSLVLSNAL